MEKRQERTKKNRPRRLLRAGAAFAFAACIGAWSVSAVAGQEEKGSQKPVELVPGLDGGQYEPYKMSVVREVQRALQERHEYSGEIDGQLDRDTMQAIQNFQEEHGIHPSGVPSPITRQRLLSGAAMANAGQGATAADSTKSAASKTETDASSSDQSEGG